MKSTALFIHGLDSSSDGRKGKYFRDQFPNMIIPDFDGDLSNRLCALDKFTNLGIQTYDDDHMLSEIFENLDWNKFLEIS